jgi:hypothetical protein
METPAALGLTHHHPSATLDQLFAQSVLQQRRLLPFS